MKKLFCITAACLLSGMSSAAFSYDETLANSYAELFAPVSGTGAAKALHLVGPDVFTEELKRGKQFTVIDIRTDAETAVLGMTLPGSMAIPLERLFQKENLDNIPTDRPIMIVCKSGTRATAAGTALRHTGFKDVYILAGGLQGLAGYYGTKESNRKPVATGKPVN